MGGATGGVSRREFVRRLSAGAAAVPGALLTLSAALDAQVSIPSEFDTSLDSIAVAFRAGQAMTLGYLSQPKAKGPHPGLVFLHDDAGLTPGARGVARSLATSGYVVVAPDFLSPQGGVASFRGMDAEVRKSVAATTPAGVAPMAAGALAFVKSHGGSGGRGVGLVGVGWGGTQAVLFAAGRSDIAACVAFSPNPELIVAALGKTTAPVLVILAGDDPETKAAGEKLTQAAVARKHTVTIVPGVTRGFHDPGETKAYKPDAAKQVWAAAIEHLNVQTKAAARADA